MKLAIVLLAVCFGISFMAWELMLALGNFGFSQYGFAACLPVAAFVMSAAGCTRPLGK